MKFNQKKKKIQALEVNMHNTSILLRNNLEDFLDTYIASGFGKVQKSCNYIQVDKMNC